MPDNTGLHSANRAKKDEFYTQLVDIENEVKHYKDKFKGKTVLCNCDDPFESNFFKYFTLNFNALKLKKLICTCYAGSPVANVQLSLFDENEKAKNVHPYKVEINKIEDLNGDGAIDLEDVKILLKKKPKGVFTRLKGDGDFRSDECVEILKRADIHATKVK